MRRENKRGRSCARSGKLGPSEVKLVAEKYRHTAAERNAMLRQLKRIIELRDERELMQFLREHGIKDENPRFSQIVKAFRDGKIDEVFGKKS
jgi:hypothetical protein